MKLAFAIVNLVLTMAGMTFFLMLYGRASSAVHRWNFIGHWSLKAGLAMFTTGAFLTMLLFPQPNALQMMRATGLALILTWAVLFHYKYFIKSK